VAFAHPVTVRFAETDAMGIVHHSSYLLWMEEARVAYLAARGRPYEVLHEAGEDFAVLEAQVTYRQAIRFAEPVTVLVQPPGLKGARFSIDYEIRVRDALRATARTVHATMSRDGRPRRPPSWLTELT
jgi:acyl-CoA thioester hydrolase